MVFQWLDYVLGGAAALLVGFSKTGMPGAAIPAVALMAEVFRDQTKLSVGAMVPILLLGDVFAILHYRRHAHWNRLLELFPYVVLGMIPGYFVLREVSGDGLRVLLGSLILVLLAVQLIRQWLGKTVSSERWWVAAATGILAGFGTTVGNAAGPVMSIYLVSKRLDKHEFLGTTAWFFFLVNLSKVPFFLAYGVITRTTLAFDLRVIPVAIIGALLGVRILKRIPQAVFDVLVLLLAGIAAVRLMLF